MTVAKAIIGSATAGAGALLAALDASHGHLTLASVLIATNAALGALALVYAVPNKPPEAQP